MKRDGTDSTIKRRLEQELQTDDFYIRNVKEKEKGESRSSSLKIENKKKTKIENKKKNRKLASSKWASLG